MSEGPRDFDRTALPRVLRLARVVALGIFWFVLGVFGAGCLALGIASMGNVFRGPAAGISELGTTRYANDQRPVDLGIGLCILSIGWFIGTVCYRFRLNAGLIAGLVIAAAILAALFVFRT